MVTVHYSEKFSTDKCNSGLGFGLRFRIGIGLWLGLGMDSDFVIEIAFFGIVNWGHSTQWSVAIVLLVIVAVGRHAFSDAGARVWNDLPADVTSAPFCPLSENV